MGRLQSLQTFSDRDLRLDGIRALAVTAVMLFHADWLPGGSIGVDVFFVLSGFLITSILLREVNKSGEIGIGRFLARRGRRLLPALAIVLIAYVALGPWLWPGFGRARALDVISAATYLTNWREALVDTHGPLAHTWSLAVEGQFYLAWPLVVLALAKRSRSAATLILLAAWLSLTALRCMALSNGLDSVAYFATPLHATGLVLGSALALSPLRPALGHLGVALAAALTFVPHDHVTFYWQLTAAEIAAALVIAAPPAWLAWRPFAWTGSISYGLYLWHVPVWLALWMIPRAAQPMAMIAISFALASASYYLIERRFQRPLRATPRHQVEPVPA